jgi:hypothetical protein
MSSVYTPNAANNPLTVTIPSDGDLASAASVNSPLADLADKAAHMNQPEQDATKSYPLILQSIFRVVATEPSVTDVNSTAYIQPKWGHELGAGYFVQIDVATAASFDHNIDVPDGCFLQSIFINLQGLPGVHGALPSTMPKVRLVRRAVATGVNTTVAGDTSDGAANVAAYEAVHQIGLACNITIDRTQYLYYLRIFGESGANSFVGLAYTGATAQYQVTKMDKGAA